MRLDKYLSNCKVLSRKECALAINQHKILINDVVAKAKDQDVNDNDIIKYNGNIVEYNEFIYIMLNKPQGVVSSTDDPRDKTVIDLLPENFKKYDLFPCGRLDKDTIGLVILTNDGVATHTMLAPKSSIQKKYYFELDDDETDDNVKKIENGIELKDGYITKPCKIEMTSKKSGYIYLTEGKYHEIKRMFGAVGNKIVLLKRISFGDIILDDNLKEGEYRLFDNNEIKNFTKLKQI